MFGYQAEVDGSDRKWSGGLYDEDGEDGFILKNQSKMPTTPKTGPR